MNILVTGGAGFIGSAVVRHIIRDASNSVVNVDKLSYIVNLDTLGDMAFLLSHCSFKLVDI